MNPDPEPQLSAPPTARTNWAGNIAFSAREFRRPATVSEVQAVVARARQIRVVATGHSFNDMADSPGAQVTLADLPPEVDVDSAASLVRVAAGVSYAELVGRLNRQGFALRNLASLPHISVAGACATGTHGSGPQNQSTSARNPVPGLAADTCTRQLGVPGPWFERLPHFRPEFTPSAGDELQSEYLLPAAHAVPALRALRQIGDRVAPVLRICEIRMIAADDLWLSPSYRQDSVAFHFTCIPDTAAVLPVAELIERCLAPFGARPHWGKIFTTSAAELRARYERLPDFLNLMRHYDPAAKFRNAYTTRYLTP